MRQYGHEISRVEGPRTNIKITTASDYYICRTFFTLNEDKAAFGGE
jgi:2-C-methyl-D-erythritol 4-phosphate cytidylyltransferase